MGLGNLGSEGILKTADRFDLQFDVEGTEDNLLGGCRERQSSSFSMDPPQAEPVRKVRPQGTGPSPWIPS
jgi:hypothetical protein